MTSHLPIDPDLGPDLDPPVAPPRPVDGSEPGTAPSEQTPGHPIGRGGQRTPWRIPAAVAARGVLGGPARYGLGLAFPTVKGTFPVTTFAINVSGSFLLALLLVFILEIWPPSTYLRPFAATGFCGAYTTFSTWMVDTDRLLAAGKYGTAAGYLVGSLFAGLAATVLGFAVGRRVLASRGGRRSDLATEAGEQA